MKRLSKITHKYDKANPGKTVCGKATSGRTKVRDWALTNQLVNCKDCLPEKAV